MNSDMLRTLIAVFGFIIIGIAIGHSIGKYQSRVLIAECEQSLQRTQHCELSAVPAQGEQNE